MKKLLATSLVGLASVVTFSCGGGRRKQQPLNNRLYNHRYPHNDSNCKCGKRGKGLR